MEKTKYSVKDYTSQEEPRWCPGCGDFAILSQVRAALSELSIPPEKLVFVSGIGCSSRFPYYMNTYGLHGIHGRAPAIALGIKLVNPDLSVWVITGDGDGLSIGGNHLLHVFRRNLDVNIILFNNEIYGLTKGQVSPTSRPGTKSASTPWGSFHRPVNPISFAFGAGATFIARTIDRNPSHMKEIIKAAALHKGVSFVEVLQNCVIYNDGAFEIWSEKESAKLNAIYLEEGKPYLFNEGKKAVVLNGMKPEVVDVNGSIPENVIIHDPADRIKASLLCNIIDDMSNRGLFPKPFGIIYKAEMPTYNEVANAKKRELMKQSPKTFQKLLMEGLHWKVQNGSGE